MLFDQIQILWPQLLRCSGALDAVGEDDLLLNGCGEKIGPEIIEALRRFPSALICELNGRPPERCYEPGLSHQPDLSLLFRSEVEYLRDHGKDLLIVSSCDVAHDDALHARLVDRVLL